MSKLKKKKSFKLAHLSVSQEKKYFQKYHSALKTVSSVR